MEDVNNNDEGHDDGNDDAINDEPPNDEEGEDDDESDLSDGEEVDEDALQRRRLRQFKKLIARVRRDDPSLDTLHLWREDQFDYINDNTEEFTGATRWNSTVKNLKVFNPFSLAEEGFTVERRCWEYSRRFTAIARSLGELKSLRVLHFTIAESDDYIAIAPFLGKLRQISSFHIQVEVPEAPPPAVCDSMLSSHPNLRELEVHIDAEGFERNRFQFPFTTSLPTLPKLREISITCTGVEFPGIDNLDRALQPTTLERINVKGFSLSAEDNLAIANLLGRNSPNLIALDLERCQIPTLNSERIVQNLGLNTSLTEFFFPCPDDAKLYHALGDCLQNSKHLQRFFVFGNSSNDTVLHQLGLFCLLNALATNGTNISDFGIVGYYWDEMLCQALEAMLCKSTSLQSLVLLDRTPSGGGLTGVSGGGLTDEIWKRIARSAAGNAKLMTMLVEGDMTPSGLRQGLQFFQDISTTILLSIFVKEHFVSEAVVGCVTDLCAMNSKLNLEVRGSGSYEPASLTIEEGETILRHLKRNYSLFRCPIVMKSLPETREKACHISCDIDSILKLNRAGRRYIRDQRSSKEHAVCVLGEVSDDLDCVYFHVRENPEMCLRGRRSSTTTTSSGRKRRRTGQLAD